MVIIGETLTDDFVYAKGDLCNALSKLETKHPDHQRKAREYLTKQYAQKFRKL